MTFWHVEQRDAREPLDCWKGIKLLLTDTPGAGATEDAIILDVLRAWQPLLAENGLMVIHSHIARVDFEKTSWKDHARYFGGATGPIMEYTAPGDIVADPFCGSGSTGVQALALGRSFIGTDIKQDQIERSFQALTNLNKES